MCWGQAARGGGLCALPNGGTPGVPGWEGSGGHTLWGVLTCIWLCKGEGHVETAQPLRLAQGQRWGRWEEGSSSSVEQEGRARTGKQDFYVI